MTFASQYSSFTDDKRAFFSNLETFNDAEKYVHPNASNYAFLANNHLLIEQEFNQLFASLQKQGQDREDFWLYCHYCCTMLHNYYVAYDKKDKADDYLKLCKKIRTRSEKGAFPEDKIDTLGQKIAADFRALVSLPKHASKIRDWIAFSNICRLHLTFCRLSVRQSLLLANELKWLEELDKMLGGHVDVNGMAATLNAPAQVFNVLSVGLFAARFIINAGMLLKHTFMPTKAELALSNKERFYQELYARHCVMLNDAVWTATNLLANFNTFFNISAPTAGWLTAGILVFDVALLIYRHHLAEKEYLFKKAQYINDKKNYELLLQALVISSNDRLRYQKHVGMLDEQLVQLEISRKTTGATLLFNIAAAVFLLGGYSASLLLATPVAVVVCYFVIVVGIAMYLSADVYGKYHEKSLMLQQYEIENRSTDMALLEMQAARNDFIVTMIKNIILPVVIVTIFAISWPAALLLTAVYVSYEYMKGHPLQDNKKPPLLESDPKMSLLCPV